MNLTAAYWNTDAEASTTSVGAIGGGQTTANAYSDGSLNSHIDGTVNATNFENMAVAYAAVTHGTGYVIALGGLQVEHGGGHIAHRLGDSHGLGDSRRRREGDGLGQRVQHVDHRGQLGAQHEGHRFDSALRGRRPDR